MKAQQFMIGQIPAVLYGEHAEQLWLFLHGQMGRKEEAEAFAKIVCPKGAQVLGIDLPGHGARQGRDEALNPWTVVPELLAMMDWARVRWDSIAIRANSIGAYFAMLALGAPDKALLVSPILDMEHLILDMMGWANVTERELSEKGEIVTSFGQTLSWAYLCYVREHPIHDWHCPICILYAGQDNMTSRQTVEEFTRHHGAQLTIMDNGEIGFTRRSSERFCKHGKIPILEHTLSTIYRHQNREHLSFEVFPVCLSFAFETPIGSHRSTAAPWSGPSAIPWRLRTCWIRRGAPAGRRR